MGKKSWLWAISTGHEQLEVAFGLPWGAGRRCRLQGRWRMHLAGAHSQCPMEPETELSRSSGIWAGEAHMVHDPISPAVTLLTAKSSFPSLKLKEEANPTRSWTRGAPRHSRSSGTGSIHPTAAPPCRSPGSGAKRSDGNMETSLRITAGQGKTEASDFSSSFKAPVVF